MGVALTTWARDVPKLLTSSRKHVGSGSDAPRVSAIPLLHLCADVSKLQQPAAGSALLRRLELERNRVLAQIYVVFDGDATLGYGQVGAMPKAVEEVLTALKRRPPEGLRPRPPSFNCFKNRASSSTWSTSLRQRSGAPPRSAYTRRYERSATTRGATMRESQNRSAAW
jgi:hypothetical protein